MAVFSIFWIGATTFFFFFSNSSSIVLRRLSGPRSRPNTSYRSKEVDPPLVQTVIIDRTISARIVVKLCNQNLYRRTDNSRPVSFTDSS
jgi:hypothetical protein